MLGRTGAKLGGRQDPGGGRGLVVTWTGLTQALAASSTPGWFQGLDNRRGGCPAPPPRNVLGCGFRDDFVRVSVPEAEKSGRSDLASRTRRRGAARCGGRGSQGRGRGQPVSKLSPTGPLRRWGSEETVPGDGIESPCSLSSAALQGTLVFEVKNSTWRLPLVLGVRSAVVPSVGGGLEPGRPDQGWTCGSLAMWVPGEGTAGSGQSGNRGCSFLRSFRKQPGVLESGISKSRFSGSGDSLEAE